MTTTKREIDRRQPPVAFVDQALPQHRPSASDPLLGNLQLAKLSPAHVEQMLAAQLATKGSGFVTAASVKAQLVAKTPEHGEQATLRLS